MPAVPPPSSSGARSNAPGVGTILGVAIGISLAAGFAYWVIFGAWGVGMFGSFSWREASGQPFFVVHATTIPIFAAASGFTAAAILPSRARRGWSAMVGLIAGLGLSLWMSMIRYSGPSAEAGSEYGGYYLDLTTLGFLDRALHFVAGWVYLLIGFTIIGGITGLVLVVGGRSKRTSRPDAKGQADDADT